MRPRRPALSNSSLPLCPEAQPSSLCLVFFQKLTNPFRMIFLARPCALTPIESYPCIKTPGGRPSPRDEKLVAAIPLDSALTNRDARKSFRIRSYENCRVSPGSAGHSTASRVHSANLHVYFQSLARCSSRNRFLFKLLHLCRGVYVPPHHSSLPTRHSPLTTRFFLATPFFSHSCALFCTHQNHNSFVFKRFRTLYQKHPGGYR